MPPKVKPELQMKALTLYQPWASLIAHGVKTIETRSWAPPRRLIGQRIAIHAGRKREVSRNLHPETLHAVLDLFGNGWGDRIPLGAIVATALLTDVRQTGFQRHVGRVLASSESYTGLVEPDPHGGCGSSRTWSRAIPRFLRWDIRDSGRGTESRHYECHKAVSETEVRCYEGSGLRWPCV